ncbi:MAG: helix-turn-helix domain-containing protein [Clostridia bacterium]|nr:helix-turn-helix domain-containing protein [Clostridia bacterium]
MQYLTVEEAAEKWGYGKETVRKWCRQGLIKITVGAEKKSGRWQIPADAQCPKKIKAHP